MTTAVCDQFDNLMSRDQTSDFPQWNYWQIFSNKGVEELIPFFARNNPVAWAGTDLSLDGVSIEASEDVERHTVPGYANPLESISVEFLSKAIASERNGDLRGSLAMIYRRIDEMTNLEMIDAINDEISSVPAEEMGTDLLLGLLTATLPVKSRLTSRPALFATTKRLLKSRGQYETGILDGLK